MFFVFIDRVSETSTFWPLVTARVVSITTISTFATLFRQEVKVAWDRRLFVIALAGIFDAGGNILFAITSSIGRLDISAVLTSLYPAGTVFLAWLILKERLSPGQWAGVAVALAAVILIAL
jgi:drug/metabolite transporter (DMT)-like permease